MNWRQNPFYGLVDGRWQKVIFVDSKEGPIVKVSDTTNWKHFTIYGVGKTDLEAMKDARRRIAAFEKYLKLIKEDIREIIKMEREKNKKTNRDGEK